jgi:O-antigen/teichoic acid export membrane protein
MPLLVGTGGSFLAALVSTAIVARLYPPTAFGELAAFLGWVAVPAAVGSLRLADAIPLTRTLEDEARVIRGAVEAGALVSLGGGLLVLIAHAAGALMVPGTLAPPFVLGFGFTWSLAMARIGTMLATKRGWFAWLAVSNLALPIGTLCGQLACYCLGGTLIEGAAAGSLLAAVPALLLLARGPRICTDRGIVFFSAHAMFPEFGRFSIPFAVLSALRVRSPYVLMTLTASGLTLAQAGMLQQAERITSWPRTALSAILRPIFHHAATSDPNQAAARAVGTAALLLAAATGPVAWCILNADLVIRVALGPGWEGAIVPFQILIGPAVAFTAADFTDRLFDMQRRQGVLLVLEGSACVITAGGAYCFAVVWPSLPLLAAMMGVAMLLYSIAALVLLAQASPRQALRACPLLATGAMGGPLVAVVQALSGGALGPHGGAAVAGLVAGALALNTLRRALAGLRGVRDSSSPAPPQQEAERQQST